MAREDDFLSYRSSTPVEVVEDTGYNRDDREYSTLKQVYGALKAEMAALDSWHAFDLVGQRSKLSLEQQIVAHQEAYNLLAPALSALESAIQMTDDKFKAAQGGNQ